MLLFSFVMTKSWIFTFGFMLFGLKMTSSPNMLRKRYDLYCLWKPFQHNCGLFFSFFYWHHQENEKKSHLSSVQQKQHILTSHSDSRMLFPEKGRKPPRMARYSDMKDEVRKKITSRYVYNNIFPASHGS